MPQNSKVARCVKQKVAAGMPKSQAIPICQKSTGQSYKTGRKSSSRVSGTKSSTRKS